jgi:hypothetical protein
MNEGSNCNVFKVQRLKCKFLKLKYQTENIPNHFSGLVCLLEINFLLESEFQEKWILEKYLPMFGSVMENKLENTF